MLANWLIVGAMATVGTLLGAISAPAAHAETEGDGSIQVKSVTEIDGTRPEITLGDLMIARNVSESALHGLRSVRLADSPRAGETRTFTAMALEQIFRPYLREIEARRGERINLRVPTRVTVVRKTFRISPEEVEAELKAQLKELCSECVIEITDLKLPAVPTSIPSGSSWKIRLRHDMPKGSFSLPLEVNHEDSSKRTYWISGQLNIRREVPVASRSISSGEKIQPNDFTLQMRDVTFENDTAASQAEIANSVAARTLGAGQVVWRNALKKEMAVKLGDAVKVMAGQDGWQVSIDGVAQGSGYIGDMIRVKIPRTQKVVSGLLTEKGQVEVR